MALACVGIMVVRRDRERSQEERELSPLLLMQPILMQTQISLSPLCSWLHPEGPLGTQPQNSRQLRTELMLFTIANEEREAQRHSKCAQEVSRRLAVEPRFAWLHSPVT